MCSHHQEIKERENYIRYFGAEPPDDLGKVDLWPGYSGSFIRRHPHADVGDEAEPQREAIAGLFGLVPHWSLDTKIIRHTYNARSETAAAKPSFREAWKRAQHCIIPAEAFYEPDWRTGKPIPTRIARADGEPMGIAGLWSWWKVTQRRGRTQLHDDLKGAGRYLAIASDRFSGFPICLFEASSGRGSGGGTMRVDS